MTDAQDTLENRLEHSLSLVETFLSAEIHERIPQRLMDGLLFSLQELLEQATDAFQEMCQQSKPDAPVKLDREDLALTLNEVLERAADSNRLIQAVQYILRGEPDPSLETANE